MYLEIILFLTFNLLILHTTNIFAAANSDLLNVVSIESRDSGHHAVYLSGAIPDQGCTLDDRGIIIESSPGGKALLSNTLTALTLDIFIKIRVSDCIAIDPDNPGQTAPKITKVQIFQEHNFFSH